MKLERQAKDAFVYQQIEQRRQFDMIKQREEKQLTQQQHDMRRDIGRNEKMQTKTVENTNQSRDAPSLEI